MSQHTRERLARAPCARLTVSRAGSVTHTAGVIPGVGRTTAAVSTNSITDPAEVAGSTGTIWTAPAVVRRTTVAATVATLLA
jgi:hypothetical protein